MQAQNHGFFWMRGKAGAGKSTMMKFLYLESKKKDRPTTMTASFFFNARGDYLEKSITGMYRSLLMQLLKKFLDLQSILDDADIIPSSQQDCPDLDTLKELLRSAVLALGQRSFTCFIDALDECDEQEVRDMVQFFEDLAELSTEEGIKLRICFSSRPYPYISIRRGISLTLEEEDGHAEDLAQYVKSKLTVNDPVLFEDLQSEILSKASGIFLWIVLTVDILNKEDDAGGLALRTKLSQIPDKLSGLFKSILMRDQQSPERLLLCILWILCAKRPLTPAEFRHALWVALVNEQPEQKDCQVDSELPDAQNVNACLKLVTSSSKGLAEITKAKQPTVQFVHESVRDFLVKERGLQSLWPDLGFEWESLSHEKLRQCCTRYLSLPEIRTIVDEDGDLQDPPVSSRTALQEKYSFLKYSAQQVLHHANAAALVVSQDDFLLQFFASGSAAIRSLNLFEAHKTRRYSFPATTLYVLADRGLENLIRTWKNKKPAEYPGYAPEETYQYPFFAALANGHKGTVAALLGSSSTIYEGVDITEGFNYKKNLAGYKGRTPLSWAAQEGRLSMVKTLVQGGANIDEEDSKGSTPLLRSLDKEHEAVIKFLIDSGADVDKKGHSNWSPLMAASMSGRETAVRLLLERKANPNARSVGNWTPLMQVSRDGHEAIVQLLIENGAEVNAQANDGWTALIVASRNGHEAAVQLLIENGAEVNAQELDGLTALMAASRYGHEAVVQLLIASGADVNIQSKKGLTAYMEAFERNHDAIARLLKSSQREEQ